MNSTNKRKYPKYSADWDTNIVKFGKVSEVDKLFKKDEVKPDGTKVTKDEGETIKVKVNDIETLLNERKALIKAKDDKLDELTKKRGYKGEAAQIYKAYRKQQELFKEWSGGNSTGGGRAKQDYITAYKDFLWDGTGTTNPYRTKGWVKLVDEYNKDTWLHNTTATDTNKYDGNIWDADKNEWVSISLTEQEGIKLLTQAVHFIGKIDKTKFDAKVDTPPSGVVLTWTTNLANAGAVKTAFNDVKNHADKLIEFKRTQRTEYSFGSDYANQDKSGMIDNVPMNKAEIEKVFNLLEFLYNNYNWVVHNDLQDAFKDIPDEFDLVVRPALATPYKESDLYGYEGFTDKKFKNSSKATNFYKTDANWDNAKTIKLKGGIMGWQRLIREFFDNHNSTDRKARVISSFDTTGAKSSPYHTLFDEIRRADDYGVFTNNGHDYTVLPFPDWLDEAETRLYELEADKDSIQTEIKDGRKDLKKAEQEYDEAKTAIKTKETEIDTKITEKITELRKDAETGWKLKASDNTTALSFGSGTDATDANRITALQHHLFQMRIEDIRFLVNFDEEKPSGKKNEDDAYQASKDITDKVQSDFSQVATYWTHITKGDDSSSGEVCKTDEERIAVIKEGKGVYKWQGLNFYHDKFVELEKLIKFDDWQTEAKNKLKKAIDNQTPEENMTEWRNNLKQIEAGLETALTDEKINKWKEKKEGKDAFNNLSSVNTLLKKVCVMKTDNPTEIDKVNDDFLAFIKGKDDKLISLTELIKQKDPSDVILYIHQWEFNKLEDTKKHERYLKFAWSELGGKQKIDIKDKLEDTEKDDFDKYLYQCAIGKINEASLTKPTEQQGPGDNNENGGDKKSWYTNPKHAGFWFLYGSLGLLVIGGVCAVIWWEKIMAWWNKDKDGDDSLEVKKDGDDSEED